MHGLACKFQEPWITIQQHEKSVYHVTFMVINYILKPIKQKLFVAHSLNKAHATREHS